MATLEPRREDNGDVEQERTAVSRERSSHEGVKQINEKSNDREGVVNGNHASLYRKGEDGDDNNDSGELLGDDECKTQEQQPRKRSRVHRKIVVDDDD